MHLTPAQIQQYASEATISTRSLQANLRCLANWQRVLPPDLSKVSLRDLRGALGALGPTRSHVVALRAFTHWLRRAGLLSSALDASADLEIPRAAPARASRSVGYSLAEIGAAYASIPAWGVGLIVREAFVLRACLGMHHSEIERIPESKLTLVDCGLIRGVLEFQHKNGAPHRVSLGARTLLAVQRIQAAGAAPNDTAMRRLCGLVPSELRHSFATNAARFGVLHKAELGGVGLDEIADVMGHRSVVTTSKFYRDLAVPPMIVLPLMLAE